MRIAVLDDWLGVARQMADWDRLQGEVTVFREPIPEPERAAVLAPFDVLCVMRERTPLPAGLIRALPRLRLIVTTGPRNLSIDLEAAKEAGIAVCGTESRGPATAHLTMAVILAATRGLVAEVNAAHAGGWQQGLGRDLDGLRLGLVGLGRLGAQVAALARPFGMEIGAWSANLTEARAAEVGAIRFGSLSGLLAWSDVASIHLVLSERTRGLIGAAELAEMKPDALLVNTSRGPIVGTEALLAALRAGRPGMAALDVFDAEPLPAGHPLRDPDLIAAGKLMLTPHLGYASRQTWEVFMSQTVEAVAAWQAGAPIRLLT